MPRRLDPVARSARRHERRYLTEVVEGGRVVGYRFNPGPALRRAGIASRLLKREDGTWMSFDEAKLARDAAVDPQKSTPGALVAPPVRKTLQALWDAFAASPAFEGPPEHDDYLKPNTQRGYRSAIKPWLAWAGDELVAALDRPLIREQYAVQKSAIGHAAAHAGLRVLMSVLSYGVREGWLAINPALKLKLKRPKGRLRLASPAELDALVKAADAVDPSIADAIVAAVWTAQSQDDVLRCDLARQLDHDDSGAWLTFIRGKTAAPIQVQVLAPLAERIGARTSGPLVSKGGAFWNASTFRHRFGDVRAAAAKDCPSVADLEFRDLRDTAITRLHLAGIEPMRIALWSGHSLKTIMQVLNDHYLVTTRAAAADAAVTLDAWRQRKGVKW